jgi:hypothetical protein
MTRDFRVSGPSGISFSIQSAFDGGNKVKRRRIPR